MELTGWQQEKLYPLIREQKVLCACVNVCTNVDVLDVNRAPYCDAHECEKSAHCRNAHTHFDEPTYRRILP